MQWAAVRWKDGHSARRTQRLEPRLSAWKSREIFFCHWFKHPLLKKPLSNWRAAIGDKGLVELALVHAFSSVDYSSTPHTAAAKAESLQSWVRPSLLLTGEAVDLQRVKGLF